MSFDAFVDAVDEHVRSRTSAEYGIYRGPHVAFWQQGDISARVRAGMNDDVEVVIAGPQAHSVVEPCTAEASLRIAETIAAAWNATP